MALHITMNNVYRLYGMDSEQKIEGMVFLHQQNQAESIFNENTRLFDGLLLAFMLKGSMTTHIHFLEHEMHRGDVAILQPQLLIETKSLTQDAEIITIGLSLDFIASFPVLREFVMNDQIRWQPVIRLQEEEFLLQKELLTVIERFYNKKPSYRKTEMLQHLVSTLMCMVSEKYYSLNGTNSLALSRSHEIIDDFYLLLSKNAKKERNVQFYADQLNLTPQYLSTFLKEKTGKSVLQWVDEIRILHAKSLLKTSHLSITQISEELHFGDTSHFCRYFKRIVGISPRAYKNK